MGMIIFCQLPEMAILSGEIVTSLRREWEPYHTISNVPCYRPPEPVCNTSYFILFHYGLVLGLNVPGFQAPNITRSQMWKSKPQISQLWTSKPQYHSCGHIASW